MIAGCASATPAASVAPSIADAVPSPVAQTPPTGPTHDDPALEGRLPDAVQGWQLRKSSESYEHLLTSNPKFAAVLAKLAESFRVSPTEVVLAVGGPADPAAPVAFGGMQVQHFPGATEDMLKQSLDRYPPVTLGGATVYDGGVVKGGGTPMHTYFYVSDDAIYVVFSNDPAIVEAAVQKLQ